MKQIINNEISNSKSVQILRAEQTLESSMKKGGVKMTMNNTKTNGTTTNKGGNKMKTLREIMREVKSEFPELSMEEIRVMAKEEWEAQFEKETEKHVETTVGNNPVEDAAMDEFMQFMWKELSRRTVVTTKVASTLIYKFANKYGKEVDEVARYTTAFIDYFVSDEGYKNTKRVGKDILCLVGLQIGKNLVSDFDILVDAAEITESVIEVKTAFDAGRAIIGAHRYAKNHKNTIVEDILDYGNSQKAMNMAYAALDEIMDEE